MQFYRHSGAVTPGGLILATLAGLATAGVLGFVYSCVIVHIPFIWVSFLATLGFGAVIGLAVGRAAKAGRIRNPVFVGILGFLLGVLGLYVAWGVDLIARAQCNDFVVAFHPLVLFNYMSWLYENGSWSISENTDPVVGVFLAAVWLVEAGLIVGLAAVMAYKATAKLTYCEHCHTWNPVEKNVRSLAIQQGQEPILDRIRSGEVAALGELFLSPPEDNDYFRVDLACCPTCSESNYLTFQMVTHTFDKEGNLKTKEKALFENLVVSDTDVELIRAAGQPLPEMETPTEGGEPTDAET